LLPLPHRTPWARMERKQLKSTNLGPQKEPNNQPNINNL
jgi:hypothetical protein